MNKWWFFAYVAPSLINLYAITKNIVEVIVWKSQKAAILESSALNVYEKVQISNVSIIHYLYILVGYAGLHFAAAWLYENRHCLAFKRCEGLLIGWSMAILPLLYFMLDRLGINFVHFIEDPESTLLLFIASLMGFVIAGHTLLAFVRQKDKERQIKI
ncbi:hypothetical protein [Paenibacillus bovis]|uniref:Uncharacterized protein n=1 Tax=Paenibacillus bovis TaxID=1616788 RepID=A0A1X9T450_9BACL|nr:hypothetical protein [Paenibacillus bovis]ARR10755.1 hypothetical protein AR543_p0147 [Paenibacillus bovis]